MKRIALTAVLLGAASPVLAIDATASTAELVEGLDAREWTTREDAAEALCYRSARSPQEERRIVVALARRLRADEKGAVREACASTLGRRDTPPALAMDALRAAIDDPNPEVARAAMGALAAYPLPSRDALPDLLRILREGQGERPSFAAAALAAYGPAARPAVPELIRRLRSRTARGRGRFALALGRLADEATPGVVPALIETLEDDPGVRHEVAKALSGMGRAAWPASRALARVAAHDRDPFARFAALEALGGMNRQDPIAHRALRKALERLRDEVPGWFRCDAGQAADALGQLIAASKACPPAELAADVDALTVALGHPRARVRAAAARALQSPVLVGRADAALGPLLTLLDDPEDAPAREALSTLTLFHGQRDQLVPALRRRETRARGGRKEAIGRAIRHLSMNGNGLRQFR